MARHRRGDREEMEEILSGEESRLRRMSYSELQRFVQPEVRELRGKTGAEYQLEVQAFIEDKKRGHLRVMVDIDDKGWRAFAPLGDSFIVTPDGSFVGE